MNQIKIQNFRKFDSEISNHQIYCIFCRDWNDWNPNDSLEEEEEEEDLIPKFTNRDATMYLIDAQMYVNDIDRFKEALKCIEANMLNSIMINDRDMVRFNQIISKEILIEIVYIVGWCRFLQYQTQPRAKIRFQ